MYTHGLIIRARVRKKMQFLCILPGTMSHSRNIMEPRGNKFKSRLKYMDFKHWTWFVRIPPTTILWCAFEHIIGFWCAPRDAKDFLSYQFYSSQLLRFWYQLNAKANIFSLTLSQIRLERNFSFEIKLSLVPVVSI